MLEEKSVTELREAVHALAEAIALIPEIYVPQKDKNKSIEAKIFSDLLKEVLAKTSHHKEASPAWR
jgi:hypothetical protein